MASTYRVNRVRHMLLRELSDIVKRMRDPRVGVLSVVDVEVSKDLKYATMFVSALGEGEVQRQAVQALESALGYVRSELAQRIDLRQVPALRVEYDSSLERAARITALINSLSENGEEVGDGDGAS